MQALIVAAHGSRLNASNEEVKLLSQHLYKRLRTRYSILNTGFLELAEPSIPEAIIQCIQKGGTDIKVLPYFLSAGQHVQNDLPNEIEKVENTYRDIKISLLACIVGMSNCGDFICD